MVGMISKVKRLGIILGILLCFVTATAGAADQLAVWEVGVPHG